MMETFDVVVDRIERHPVVSDLLRRGTLGEIRGAYVPFLGTLSPSCDDGILLAGDSCGFVIKTRVRRVV